MPKFQSGNSLIIGAICGFVLAIIGWTLIEDGRWLVGVLQVAVGTVLSLHCLNMIKFWKTHKIVETKNEENSR